MKAFLAAALLWLVLDGSQGEETNCSEGPSACEGPMRTINMGDELDNADSKAEAILRICPQMKRYFSCMNTYANSCPSDVEPEKMSALLNLVNELCDPETQLHQAFLNHFDCLFEKKIITHDCHHQAKEQEVLYVSYYGNAQEVDEQLDKEVECLYGYLLVDCIASKVKQTCGREGSALVLQLANRSGSLCSVQEQEMVLVKYLVMMAKSDNGASDFMRLFKRSARTK